MNNDVEITQGGLKCDNPECDWVDVSVKIEDYENWLNAPCPKCGQNVLTEEDYQNVLIILTVVEMTSGLSPEELKAFSESMGLEGNPFSSLPGLENVKPDDKVIMSFSTHKEIKVTGIRPADEEPANEQN